jgi:hypothetical protein
MNWSTVKTAEPSAQHRRVHVGVRGATRYIRTRLHP